MLKIIDSTYHEYSNFIFLKSLQPVVEQLGNLNMSDQKY